MEVEYDELDRSDSLMSKNQIINFMKQMKLDEFTINQFQNLILVCVYNMYILEFVFASTNIRIVDNTKFFYFFLYIIYIYCKY